MPLSAFLDPEKPEMRLWIRYTCPVLYPGLVPSTIPHLSSCSSFNDDLAYRQFAGADFVLRSGSKYAIQYVNLRYGYDQWAGGELARVNVSTDGDQVEEFGTIMMKNFLILVDPEELSCKEIEDALKDHIADTKTMLRDIHTSVKGEVERDDGGDLVRVGKFNVYSTARRILRAIGKMKKSELSKNYFNSGLHLRYRNYHNMFCPTSNRNSSSSVLCRTLIARWKRVLELLKNFLRQRCLFGWGSNSYETRAEMRLRFPINSRFWPSYFFRSSFSNHPVLY